MNEDIITLELGLNSSYKYRVHPSVPLAILEYYYRKKPNKVVGTLLGLVYPDHVDITNCYAVKYEAIVNKTENDDGKQIKEYALDKEYHKKMLELNQKIYPKELVVGFFITQSELDIDVAALNQYFSNTKESSFTNNGILQAPIILTINPELENGSFDMRAFSNMSLPILKDSYSAFQQLNLCLEFFEEDKNESGPMISKQLANSGDKNQLDIINLDSMEQLLIELIQNLKIIQKYINDIRQNKAKEDIKLGKIVKKLLNLRPMLSKDEFASLISKHMQDVLIVMFLSNVAHTQALISEKLIKI